MNSPNEVQCSPVPAKDSVQARPAGESAMSFTIEQVRAAVRHWGADALDRQYAKPGASYGPNATLAIEVLATMDFQKEVEGSCPPDSQLALVISAVDAGARS